jgi:selenocysteine lyase/cysteine desulfurase
MKSDDPFQLSAGNAEKALFDIPDDVTYLNCANMAPQLRSVTEAGIKAVRAKQTPWTLTAPEWFSSAEELRTLAARLLGTTADAVALVPAVSHGIAIAAANLPVSRGQKIVLLDQEFPSNVYAWRELARKKGGQVVHVQRRTDKTWTEALEEAIDLETAVVSVPHCHWTDGSKIDLERVSELARKAGAALVIDASQSLGAQPLDLARVQPDFLVAVGYKWLLGPYGLGYLYVGPKWRELGTPIEQSWLTRALSENFSRLVEYTDDYRPGARRFDMGEFPQFVLVPMAIAALQQILAWGVAHVANALAPLTSGIAQLAVEHGYSVLAPEQRCTHMIGIRHRDGISSELAAFLREQKVFVSIRGDSIRVAPHLYSDTKDVDRFFDVLSKRPLSQSKGLRRLSRAAPSGSRMTNDKSNSQWIKN